MGCVEYFKKIDIVSKADTPSDEKNIINSILVILCLVGLVIYGGLYVSDNLYVTLTTNNYEQIGNLENITLTCGTKNTFCIMNNQTFVNSSKSYSGTIGKNNDIWIKIIMINSGSEYDLPLFGRNNINNETQTFITGSSTVMGGISTIRMSLTMVDNLVNKTKQLYYSQTAENLGFGYKDCLVAFPQDCIWYQIRLDDYFNHIRIQYKFDNISIIFSLGGMFSIGTAILKILGTFVHFIHSRVGQKKYDIEMITKETNETKDSDD